VRQAGAIYHACASARTTGSHARAYRSGAHDADRPRRHFAGTHHARPHDTGDPGANNTHYAATRGCSRSYTTVYACRPGYPGTCHGRGASRQQLFL